MRNENYTPVPWMVEINAHGDVYVVDKNGGDIAIVWGSANSQKQDEANGHLISAAPELYEILKTILDNAVVNGIYAEQARAILRKARGEE